MSEQKPRVAIVGLGTIGASMGMRLRQAAVTAEVVGHDRDGRAATQAKRMGAVDRTDWNLISACETADLVILALPLGGVRQSMEALAPHLRQGCVVLDTAPVKGAVLTWADELLPPEVHYVGLSPILGSPAGGPGPAQLGARSDLFENRLICLMPSPRAAPDATKLAIDLVAILGGRPLFYDAPEHDGLAAAVDQLPSVLALALLETMTAAPTWREMRKLAGPAFEVGTLLADTDAVGLGEACAANRHNVVRWIDALCSHLESIREALEADPWRGHDEDVPRLAERLGQAQAERGKWMQDRATGLWEPGLRSEMPERQSMLRPLLGGLTPQRPRRGRR